MLRLLATTARVKPLLRKLADLVTIFSRKFVKPGKQKPKSNSYRHTTNSAIWDCLGNGRCDRQNDHPNYSLVVRSFWCQWLSLGHRDDLVNLILQAPNSIRYRRRPQRYRPNPVRMVPDYGRDPEPTLLVASPSFALEAY